jgi:hypothetical protein
MIDRDGDDPPLRRAESPKQAKDDLRAKPFTEDVFDDEYYGRRRRGGTPFGLIVGVVFGAAVAAVAGWYIFGTRQTATVTADGDQLVKADPSPYKTKPENPGGLQVDNQDKLVYDRLNKAASPSRVENLLPEPEQPKAPPVKKAQPAPTPAVPPPQPTASGKDDPLAKLVAEVAGPDTTAATPTASPSATPAAAPAPVAVPAAASDVSTPAAEAQPAAAAPPTTSAPSAPSERPSTSAVAAAAPAAAPNAAAPSEPQTAAVPAAPVGDDDSLGTPTGSTFVQLASTRSEEAALAEWKRISGKHADVLGGLTPAVSQAEIPERGTVFRLRAGPIADRAAADTLCATLSSRNVGCIVVRP